MVLRYLLQSWLQRAAQDKLRETVTEAARRQFSQSQTAESSPSESPPCEVGVAFALSIESAGLEDLIGEIVATRGHGFTAKQGRLGDRRTVILETGTGQRAAAQAAEALIVGHRPAWLLSAGFAGALSPSLKRYDLVVADSLLNVAGNRLVLDLKMDRSWLAGLPGVHVGHLLTVDQVARTAVQKRSLGETTHALAVDMETYAVAEVCRQHRLPFLAIRVVVDLVDEQLPNDIDRLVRQKSTMSRFGAALGAAWQRPGSIKDMYQLREHSLIASDRLARFLAVVIQQLSL